MPPWLRAIGEVLAVAAACSLAGVWSASTSGRARPGSRALFLVGGLFALAVRPLVATLSLSPAGLVLALWLLLFVLGFLLSMIEAAAFSDGRSQIGWSDVRGAMVLAAIVALAAGAVMRTPSPGSIVANVERWIVEVGAPRLLLRLLGSTIAFMVAYCAIGSIAWRFVRPYYSDPKLGLRLRIPSGRVVILLQLGRGLLAALALAPLLASSSAHALDAWARLALALAVTSGVIPLLLAVGWPLRLRVIHAVEIVVFACVYALALVLILRL